MYSSIMWDYMEEEKAVLAAQFKTKQFVGLVKGMASFEAVYITAHGSSYNAAVTVSDILAQTAHVRVYVYTPSDLLYNGSSYRLEDPKRTLVMGISQTGTSNGVLKALSRAKEQGFSILGVTAEIGSPIDRLSDFSFILACGPENSNAKTKGYSCTLLFLLQLAYELGAHKGVIPQQRLSLFHQEVQREIELIPDAQQLAREWCEDHDYGKGMKKLFVMGNGAQYGSALEATMKLMETQCIPTLYTSSAEFSHGMHRCLKQGDSVILITSPEDPDEIRKTYAYLKEKGAEVLMIDTQAPSEEDRVIALPYFETTRSTLLAVAVLQVVSAFVPENNGYDPNREANDDYTEVMKTRG